MAWFYQQISPMGKWTDVLVPERPSTNGQHVKRMRGQGPKFRNLREVPDNVTLDEARTVRWKRKS